MMKRFIYEYPGWLRDRRKAIRLIADYHGLNDEYANVVVEMLSVIMAEELGGAKTRDEIYGAITRSLTRVKDLDAYVEAEWIKRGAENHGRS